MNQKSFRTLEYDKIIQKLVTFANSSLAQDFLQNLTPSTDLSKITTLQKETSEAVSMILKKGELTLSFKDISSYLKRVSIEGQLNMEELLNIAAFLNCARISKNYAKEDNKNENFLLLKPKFADIETIDSLEKEILKCIISTDEISDNASDALFKIRQNIKNTNNSIKTELNKILHSKKTIMQEPVITMRGDRYCVPIKAEYKNSFLGIVHDQSSTGSTFFIEPDSVVALNNKIKELKSEEIKEINKILKNLSEKVFEYKDILSSNLEILKQLDIIFARAKYSISINGTEPVFNQEGYINLKKARHPLLDKANVVPLDIHLGKDFTTLLITGPNTGGKTVTLKTVGLFVLMAQSGLHIPAFDKSSLCVFDNIFSDIGDEQSIEQSLSTFSAHLKNIVFILNNVTPKSLVLLDELGAGTDPTEGACLAIAIIKHLHKMSVRTIITSHYSELKVFALSTNGVLNASCEFDLQTLKPTYKLLIGIPGKSNAFAISKKLGLSQNIIEEAKSLLTKEDKKLEEVLTDLEISNVSLLAEQEKAKSYRKEIEILKNELQKEREKIKARKEKIISKAMEDAKAILYEATFEATKAVKDIKKIAKQNANSANIDTKKEGLKNKIKDLDKNISKFNKKETKILNISNLKVNDGVFINSMQQHGIVTKISASKKDIFVAVGNITIKTNISDLSIDESYIPPKKETKKTNHFSTVKNKKALKISSEIDLRGAYVQDAIERIDKFIDDAYLGGINIINIIHGKGTGALRAGIWQFLKKHTKIKSFRQGEFGEGDAGVTVVELK